MKNIVKILLGLFVVLSVCGCKDQIAQLNAQFPIDEKIDDMRQKAIKQYFWGTWMRMDNGDSYEINEKTVTAIKKDYSYNSKSYDLTSCSDSVLVVETLGTFKKQSDNVMVCNSIPYFRKGGTNLTYSMKLVGFSDTVSRAVSGSKLSGLQATGQSETIECYSSSGVSDEDGNVTLTAPVAGDIQTITIKNGGKTVAVVPEVKIENNGTNIGTIPISEDGRYSLKVTGTIPMKDRDNGYLFAGTSYEMEITITNTSDVDSKPSYYILSAENSDITISGTEREGSIGTLRSGFTKKLKINLICNAINSAYIDTGISVNIENVADGKTWTDYVPIRFYKNKVPVTIATVSQNGNTQAKLNGFIIYPDGNSQYFNLSNNCYRTIYVPNFGSEKPFILAFCGAMAEGSYEKSTEMFYTVVIGSTDYKTLTKDMRTAYPYGETYGENDSEITAYETSDTEFEAYLAVDEIDFYKIHMQ